ncbi:reverse transcriptase [Gossypium australe]|uniref:Reverse transcriptase n=1 Tax=Gossypium australe TaxID=47621 RepID=A0A5B6VQ09_9ROSI|nr:reverse transcriptase [Gossypium australe]
MFFHRFTSQRRRTNRIRGLQGEDERIIIEQGGSGNSDHILEGVRQCIMEEQNGILSSKYEQNEILAALKKMAPTKASGPDGTSLLEINCTHIVLIPRIANSTRLVHFQPISLCSVIYKIISKTVVNRFQKVLNNCIDEAQSAFVSGRQITNNILLAYEVLNAFKQKRTKRRGFFTLKLDMSKPFNKVEWMFLREVMLKNGFFN